MFTGIGTYRNKISFLKRFDFFLGKIITTVGTYRTVLVHLPNAFPLDGLEIYLGTYITK